MATFARRRSSKAALAAGAIALAAAASIGGQAPPQGDAAGEKRQWVLPRTPDGHPDLQGTWTNETITPLERPDRLLDLPGAHGLSFRRGANAGPVDPVLDTGPVPATLTPEQAQMLERHVAQNSDRLDEPSDPDRPAPPQGGDGSTGAAGNVGGYNNFWLEPGMRVAVVNGEFRSSLIVDPPDGKIPPRTAEGAQRQADAMAALKARGGEFDHPEFRPLAERCLMSFGSNAGPPMLPNYFYNNNYQIVQTRDHVMILVEMVHDVRVIRLGGERLPPHVRPWMGDSIGRWEGDTLVVETTNFPAKQGFAGSSEQRRVVERFTRADEHTMLYTFTIDDPSTFASPWSGEVPFRATDQQIYEYACHEGNYALSNVLSGARAQERLQAESQGGK
jgi:hypothetical protein